MPKAKKKKNMQGKEEAWNSYDAIDFVNCRCPLYDAAFLEWVDKVTKEMQINAGIPKEHSPVSLK